jgi:hypothetical protein
MSWNHLLLILYAAAALVTLLFIVAVLRWIGRRPSRKFPYFSKKFLLSDGERAFYRSLLRAIPARVAIVPKVRLADLINCSPANWKAGFGSKIAYKHVDFVPIDIESTALLLVIELDDQSHRRKKVREADEFKDGALGASGIPILRFAAKAGYNVAEIRNAVLSKIQSV